VFLCGRECGDGVDSANDPESENKDNCVGVHVGKVLECGVVGLLMDDRWEDEFEN